MKLIVKNKLLGEGEEIGKQDQIHITANIDGGGKRSKVVDEEEEEEQKIPSIIRKPASSSKDTK